jgi:hypothetical protein
MMAHLPYDATFRSATEDANGVVTYIPDGLNGYSPGAGQMDNYNPTYTFDSRETVPDGGVTVGLLGMALVGMSVIRRKLAK